MDDEKIKKLLFDYPFIKRGAISGVGEGWEKLLRYCFDQIADYPPPDSFEITQVKEKFGTLRIYYAIHDISFFYMMEGQSIQDSNKKTSFRFAVDRFIREAEDASFITCEVCGSPGKEDRSHNWIKTLCQKHKEERK